MSVRKINYYISESDITPSEIQYGGIQGEHNATVLIYNLTENFREYINSYEHFTLSYRFDIYDGAGHLHQTVPQEIPASLSYIFELPLSEVFTRHGGVLHISLVITHTIENGETDFELFSFPSIIRIKQRPLGDGFNTYRSVTSLAEKTAENEKKAQEYLEKITQLSDEIVSGTSKDLLIIPVASNLPEANEENRGRMVIVPNGENDEVYICIKVNGKYSWIRFGTSASVEEDITFTSNGDDTVTMGGTSFVQQDDDIVLIENATFIDNGNETITIQ